MTITLTRKEAQQVLDAMISKQCGGCYESSICCWEDVREAIETLRTRLAEPEPEPMAWLYAEGLEALQAGKCWTAYGTKQDDDCCIPVYTAPPAILTITNSLQASEHIEQLLWDFVHVAGAFPNAKRNPETWKYVMVYAPKADTKQPHE